MPQIPYINSMLKHGFRLSIYKSVRPSAHAKPAEPDSNSREFSKSTKPFPCAGTAGGHQGGFVICQTASNIKQTQLMHYFGSDRLVFFVKYYITIVI